MMRKLAGILTFAIVTATGLHAQMAERIDPVTGNYVPVREKFLQDDPDADTPNPNRLANRVSKRNSPRAHSAANPIPDKQTTGDDLTPAQQVARAASNNSQAPAIALAQDDPMAAVPYTPGSGLVSMSGMSTYVPPSQQSDGDGPFAQPNWWPQ